MVVDKFDHIILTLMGIWQATIKVKIQAEKWLSMNLTRNRLILNFSLFQAKNEHGSANSDFVKVRVEVGVEIVEFPENIRLVFGKFRWRLKEWYNGQLINFYSKKLKILMGKSFLPSFR